MYEYKNCSQIHECGNWERGRAVSFLGVHVLNFRYSAPTFTTAFQMRIEGFGSEKKELLTVGCLVLVVGYICLGGRYLLLVSGWRVSVVSADCYLMGVAVGGCCPWFLIVVCWLSIVCVDCR